MRPQGRGRKQLLKTLRAPGLAGCCNASRSRCAEWKYTYLAISRNINTLRAPVTNILNRRHQSSDNTRYSQQALDAGRDRIDLAESELQADRATGSAHEQGQAQRHAGGVDHGGYRDGHRQKNDVEWTIESPNQRRLRL